MWVRGNRNTSRGDQPMLKLPGHGRYDHSPIVSRKDYSWPDGKRLAFYIALNIEHFAFGAGLGMDPTNRGGPQTSRNFAWRDYGNRFGNWRLFEILDELKLPATILLNSSVCYHYPNIIEKIKARGDDVLGHGRTNAELLRPMWEQDEARAIQECTEVIEKHVGVRPTGWMGSSSDSLSGCDRCGRPSGIASSTSTRIGSGSHAPGKSRITASRYPKA